MTKTWVVVADANRARIFSAAGPLAPLTEEVELQSHEFVPETAEKRGRRFTPSGAHRQGYQPRVEPKRQSLSLFAKHLAEHLSKARTAGKYASLVLVAAPAILGMIRHNLDAQTAKMLSRAVSKDLVRLEPAELRKQLG